MIEQASAWGIHYFGGATVGSTLERLESENRQLKQTVTELGETVQKLQAAQSDDRQELERVREAAEDAQNMAGES